MYTTINNKAIQKKICYYLKDTISFVMKKHRNQFRKTGEKFYLHPVRMFWQCLDHNIYDLVILKSILLHDVVEDSDVDINFLYHHYWSIVWDVVNGLTGIDEKKLKIQKRIYFKKFVFYGTKDWRVFIVKLFDILDNLKTLHWLECKKQYLFKKEKKDFYLPVFINSMGNIPKQYKSIFYQKLLEMKDQLNNQC